MGYVDEPARIDGKSDCLRSIRHLQRLTHGPSEGDRHAVEVSTHLKTAIESLPAKFDRDSIYDALAPGLNQKLAHEFIDPAWCRDRDEAVARVSEAVESLARVLRLTGLDTSIAESCIGPLREQVAVLRNHPFIQLQPGLVNRRKTRGRPVAAWLKPTEDRLAALGLSRTQRRDVLAAAGLVNERPCSENPQTI